MAFFTLSIPSTATPPKEINCGLRLFVNQNTGKYDYKFSELNYLLENRDDTLFFFIRNEIPNTTAHFFKHIYSGPELNKKGLAKMSLTKVNGFAPVQDPKKHYEIRPTQATFKFDLDDFEMIHIGLAVEIMDTSTPAQRIELMLCDPQVGNGPP